MGQYWELVDLDGRQTFSDTGGKLGEWFWNSGEDIMDALRTPVPNPKVDELLQSTVADQHSSKLLGLAQELYDLVLDELEDMSYMALLSCAVTCKAALARTRRHVEAHQRRYVPRGLVGHRLICVGEYAKLIEQLPFGMLTEEEQQHLRDYGERFTGDPNLRLWAYAFHHLDRRSNYDLRNPNASFQQLFHVSAWAMPQRWRLNDWALVMGVVCYPKHWPWALCNLVKREYVREQAATQLCRSLPSDQRRPWNSDRPEFWHFLLANICCSSDSSYAMAYQGEDLAKGRWAGDRFAITPLDNLSLTAHSEGKWKDVTDEVAALVKRLWDAERP